MELRTPRLVIRNWKDSDIIALTRNANDPEIAMWLRDGFPFPYTSDDAFDFLRVIDSKHPATVFAIDLNGEAIGSIGYFPKENIYRLNAEIGYWLGKSFWGNGYITETIIALTDWIFANTEIVRLYAQVFEGNLASARVLEKAGYCKEANLQRSIIKNGIIKDEWIFARLKNAV